MQQVRETRQLFTILEAMQDGIYIVDQEYTIQYMNSAMIAEFSEGQGRKCHEVFFDTDSPCTFCEAPRVFFDQQTVMREIFIPKGKKNYEVIEMPFSNRDGSVSKLAIFRDISRRKIQESKLRDSQEDYKTLFDHVGCGVFISSKEGKFLNVNQALLEMLGYDSKEEFLDIDIVDDLYVRPEDRQKFRQMIEHHGRVIDYEVDFKRKDGSILPVLLTGHVRYDHKGNVLGYEGINVDQSQRKQMEQELKAAHDFFDNMIQSSPNAIMATDMQGNIIIWNRSAEETLGYTAEETIGKMNIVDVYPDGMARKVMRMMRSDEYGAAGKLRSFPLIFKRKDGSDAEGNLSAAIIYDPTGQEIASVGIFVDLEERLKMELKLRQTQEQLLQSEKLAAMGRLTSQIAHELNNPLYGIMNTLELMKTEISPQNKRRRLLDMALSETERLSDLLRKMLSFSKPEHEERRAVDLNAIIDEILLLHAKQLQEHSIKIVQDLSPSLPPVMASTSQLRQVFLNMIANARDAMPDGGTLTVETSADHKQVKINIIDSGVGIEPEHRHKIFEAFFTTKSSVKGVGLGLSVCYGFIRDHGGDIQVESAEGDGTTFAIYLPVSKEGPAA